MTTDLSVSLAAQALANQPHRIVDRDGVRFALLGTAHVSKTSVDAVRAAIASGEFDAVAIELDAGRLQSLSDPDALAKLDLIKVLREGKTHLFAANLALSAYQRRLAEQLDVEPGAELKAGAEEARRCELPLHLIDREVGLTFKRALNRLSWWGRAKISAGIMAAMLGDEEVGDDEIEKLKQGDLLEASFGEFATDNPALYDTVIAERDRYMASRLRQVAEQAPAGRDGEPYRVLAVVGAGHLQGLANHLRDDAMAPAEALAELEHLPEKSDIPWFTIALGVFLLGGFVWGFWQGGIDVGAD
ncbi:MAG TPA: TraB/GumN family protein, partial [Pseudoxanthomonas sp.]|nr:TraB/GumN family protein [Pseudoxanthomonas sp.]